jgi:hypothetical protein
VSRPSRPFWDIDTPSPLAPVASLLRSSASSVVRADGLDDVQTRAHVDSAGLEEKLLSIVRASTAPALILFGGSAGTGKSELMARLLARAPEAFGETIADATHTESPDEEQVDRLAAFFAPFADGRPPADGPSRMIAMNTGMAIRFFQQVRSIPAIPALSAVERLVLTRLGIGFHPAASPALAVMDWLAESVLVINLDLRRTSGGSTGLLLPMLASLAPDDLGGILGGAERCATCSVIDWCWPRTNAELLSTGSAASVLDAAMSQVALERVRQIPPRELWGLAAGLVLGGAAGPDPCESVAAAFEDGDVDRVRRGLLPGDALDELARRDGLAARLVAADPAFRPSPGAHDEIAIAGIDPGDDGERLLELLGSPDLAHRRAVRTVAAHVAKAQGLSGRYRARARWFAGCLPYEDPQDLAFNQALAAYGGPPDVETDTTIRETVALGLARSLGDEAGPETFLPMDRPGDERSYRVLVGADLRNGKLLELMDDPVLASNPVGAKLVGYTPLAITMRLGGTDHERPLTIDLPTWQLLQSAAAGTLPGTVDLERLIGLRRAVEAAVRAISLDPESPLLISHAATGRRWRAASVRTRGGEHIRVYEVH